MSEPSGVQATVSGEYSGRVFPVIVYILYLLGLFNGLTILVGLIFAYVYRDRAEPLARSHFVFQVRTCWMGLALIVACAALAIVGLILSVVLIGLPILWLAGAIASLVGVWFAVRCIVGLYYLVQNQPYPRPDSWLI